MPPMPLQWACPSQPSGQRRSGQPRRLPSAVAATSVFLVLALGWVAAGAAPAPPPTVSWSSVSPPASPPPLAYAAAAYDADTSNIVLFGGIASDGSVSGATWIWNGSTWSQPIVNLSPPPRELASMAFDPSLHQLILFGGQAPNGQLLGDTWAWNGRSWYQVATNGPSPGPREAAAMAFERSGSLVLFGGTGSAAGSASTSTTTLPGVGSSPPAAGDDTVLNDTWLWTPSGWVRSTAAGPPARSGAAMAYDHSNGTTVLFGGEATPTSAAVTKPLSDTWVWNGSGWTATKSASSPPARFESGADDFSGLGGVLLVAGEGPSGATADGWVWTGATWTQATIRGSSSPRIGAATAYDSASQAMVVFGGAGGGGTILGDTSLVRVVPAKPTPTTARPTSTTTTAKPTSSSSTVKPTPTTKPPTTTAHGTVASGSSTTVAQGSGPIDQPPRPTLQTDQSTVQRGDTVQLSGAGFSPGSVVTLMFHSSPEALLGSAVVALNGTFTKIVTVPAGAAPGEHHFTVTGESTTGTTARLSATVTVVAPAHHKGISTVATLSLVGLALLIPVAAYLGMATAGAWRRRSQKAGS